MKNKLNKLILAAVGVLACSALTTQAIQISGDISFKGDGSYSISGGVTTFSFNNVRATGGELDYATVPYNYTPVTFNNIAYTGSGFGAALTTPVVPQWSLSYAGVTYSFDLSSISQGTIAPGSQGAFTINLAGTGTAFISGYTPTAASWSLTGSGTGTTLSIVLGDTIAVPGVPDGGLTLGLLGFAMVGIEGLRRRLSK